MTQSYGLAPAPHVPRRNRFQARPQRQPSIDPREVIVVLAHAVFLAILLGTVLAVVSIVELAS